ncbi:hypothetical protein H4217_005664 [Coemansia sp. RSA 1939]|nr:hypothetical protein H4217_005664 [Coemansia sp. RSA 1939]KAJ2592096.1 hypothetical protein EV177_008782 [Coemansia sp. RSA 1804]KAJ2673276.1 hypothetical protein GGH99_006048 [Coemansia sp. RSA 1285]
MAVSVLILGCGFVGKYLGDLLKSKGVSFAATTTDGREGTTKWRLPGPEEEATAGDIDFHALPEAQSIVITFPLQGRGIAKRLVDGYIEHIRALAKDGTGNTKKPLWVYLGSTRPFKEMPSTYLTPPDMAAGGVRVEAEEYLIQEHDGCVLNLAGLWGGARDPKNWSRFYPDKEKLRKRLADRSLHLVHGADVARAIYAVISQPEAVSGGRWLVSDKRVHDALEIYIGDTRIRGLVQELLKETETQSLVGTTVVDDIELGPSAVSMRIDSSHFWNHVNIEPIYPFVTGRPDPYPGV